MLDGGNNRRSQSSVTHRRAWGNISLKRDGVQRPVYVLNDGVPDLFEIVVGRCQPEDGNSIKAGTGGFLREANGGEGFQDREKWPAEKANLLAGEYGECAGAEAFDVFEGPRRRTEFAVLALEDTCDEFAAVFWILDFLCNPWNPGGGGLDDRLRSAVKAPYA